MLDISNWPVWAAFILFVFGILLTIKGGDYFVDAASQIAEILKIPKFIIGATVVSIATTLPELLVSCFAALSGSIDMAVGNAVGSVTANTGLIMAISLLFMPAVVKRSHYAFKAVLLIVATAVVWIFSITFGDHKSLSHIGSGVLLILFAFFIYENIKSAKREMSDNTNIQFTHKALVKNISLFTIGALGIVFGAEFLVDSSSLLAQKMLIPETVISVTIVAVGTSLPELVTTITAITKKQSSLSVGNILGANIIDIAIILPSCSVISGKELPISAQGIFVDMPICLICVLVAVLPMLKTSRFYRWQGVLLIGIYIAYLILITAGKGFIPF